MPTPTATTAEIGSRAANGLSDSAGGGPGTVVVVVGSVVVVGTVVATVVGTVVGTVVEPPNPDVGGDVVGAGATVVGTAGTVVAPSAAGNSNYRGDPTASPAGAAPGCPALGDAVSETPSTLVPGLLRLTVVVVALAATVELPWSRADAPRMAATATTGASRSRSVLSRGIFDSSRFTFQTPG